MLNEATKQNLRRKSTYVDDVQMFNGLPLFSWIDLNLTELCNRKCVFCPRVDESVYPNQSLHMSVELAEKMGKELKALNYQGAIVFCGYGEPMLCPHIEEIVAAFPKDIRLELVTNGDKLTPENVNSLIRAGLDYFVVSMYDGPEQIAQFDAIFEKAGCDHEYYILRDRWHNEEDSFGLKLTNRAGVVNIGNQDDVDVCAPCFYPAYSMTIDWNGDVLLCVQDWNKLVKAGNVYAQSLMDIWTSKTLDAYRRRLMNGKRTKAPCSKCNADGTLHGFNHRDAWDEHYRSRKEPRGENRVRSNSHSEEAGALVGNDAGNFK